MLSVNACKIYRITFIFYFILSLSLPAKALVQSPLVISHSAIDDQFSSHISDDNQGNFWLSTHTGIYRFDGLNTQKINSDIIKGLKGFTYKDILINKNEVWLNSDIGLERVNLDTQTSQIITSQSVSQPTLDHLGQLWFINSGQLKTYYNKKILNVLGDLQLGVIESFILLQNHTAWLINKEKKLLKVNLLSKKITTNISLNQSVIKLSKDSQDTVWLLNNNFKLQSIKNDTLVDYKPLQSESMFRVLLSNQGSLYFYNSKGAFVHDLNSKLTHKIIKSDQFPIHNIFLDKTNSLWLQKPNGDWQNYPTSLVKASALDKSIKVSLESLKYKMLNINQIININNKNWLAANDLGLYLKSNNHDIFQISNIKNIANLYYSKGNLLWFSDNKFLYSFDLLNKSIINTFPIPNITGITSINEHQILVSTNNALYRLNNDKLIQQQNQDLGVIQNIYYNQDTSTLWLASLNGLFKGSLLQGGNFVFDKVLSGRISNILPSEKNYLWLVINNQLSLINIKSHELIQKNIANLVQASKELIYLNNKVIFKDKILSVETRTNKYIRSALKISAISYYDGSGNKKINISPKDIINLSSDNNNIQIKIADELGSNNPNYNFEYRLSNQSNWFSLGKGNSTLTLSRLPVGQHVLQIQNANDLSIKSTQLIVNVVHSTYNVFWYILFSVVIVLIAFYIYRKLNTNKATSDTLTSSLLKQTKEAIWIANHDFKIQQVNPIFTQITGFDEQSVINKSPRIYSPNGRNRKLERLILQELEENDFWSGEVWSCRKNGDEYSLDLSITRVNKNPDNTIPNYQYVGMFSDITNRKCNERELRQLATRDPITHLPNRTLFIEHLDKAITSCNQTFPTFALLFIDLDNFHKINDSFGHSQGDLLIEQLAQRLKSKLEKGFTIARLGGDEFAVLIPPYLYSGMTLFYAKRVADNILSLCKSPFNLNGIDISITTSIGISRYPDNGVNCEMLMRSADTALVHAKKNGKNCFQFFDKSQSKSTPELLSQEHNLSLGIESEELILYYQPKYNTQENKIVGFEALVRWPQKDGSMVKPDDFIPMAETNGMIVPLTLSLFKQACKQIKLWRNIIEINGRIAINLSARHFQQVDLVKDLTHCLATFNISGRTIELEVTESAMMDNPDFALKQMNKLKALGFTIALDDFGTGHSSLSYLKKFPIDRLKIDRSFILDITNSEQDRNITSTIIQLAKYLNIEVVAEGVETKEQAYLLHIMGCQVIQGYYFSRPIPACDVINIIKQPTKIQNS